MIWLISLFLLPFVLASSDGQMVSSFLHEWCLNRIAITENREIYEALICGKKLPFFGELRGLFSSAGLVHFMVVSGAHLIFLEKCWSILPKHSGKSALVAASLILYALMTQMHPPVFRALVSFFIFQISNHFKLFWSPCWRIMFSGGISLLFNPAWVISTSLQMSWAGALAFSYARGIKLLACVMAYLVLTPWISQWTLLQPASVLLNWTLFAIITILLFPR